jgi:hypothetical protein
MTATIIRLLPADEQTLLIAYVEGTGAPAADAAIYDVLEVPDNARPPRIAVAVAQILLHHVQGSDLGRELINLLPDALGRVCQTQTSFCARGRGPDMVPEDL